jgi:uncharacterized protein YcaQ
VGTAKDLADYYRLNTVSALLEELVEAGRFVPASSTGGGDRCTPDPEATVPRWVRALALLSPFDC